MRSDADHAGEEAEEMKRAQLGVPRRPGQIDRLVSMGVDPARGFDRTAPIARTRAGPLASVFARRLADAGREEQTQLLEIGSCRISPLDGRLRELADHHELRKRRQAADLP